MADSAPRVLIFVNDIGGYGKLMIITPKSPTKGEQRRAGDTSLTQRSSEVALVSTIKGTGTCILRDSHRVKYQKVKKNKHIHTYSHTPPYTPTVTFYRQTPTVT